MNKKLFKVLVSAAALLLAEAECVGEEYRATSPDKRNEIRLSAGPVLTYSVYRDGVERVAPTPLSMEVEGQGLLGGEKAEVSAVSEEKLSGRVRTRIYKKSHVNQSANSTKIDFEGGWRINLIARNDAVAYRFETSFPGRVKVIKEEAGLTFPETADKVYAGYCLDRGDPLQNSWESIYATTDPAGVAGKGETVYLPLVVKYRDGAAMCVSESDLLDYPGWNLKRAAGKKAQLSESMARFPAKTHHHDRDPKVTTPVPMRRIRVDERAGYIAETEGARTYPWRVFMLAENEIKFCENDAVYALATPSKVEDVSWIKPGLAAWEWWNGWNVSGVDFEAGINTATYVHYIDFAGRNGVPYLVVDAGWTEKFQLSKYNPDVDIEYLIKYGAKRNVGLILWTTWPQLDGRQEEVFEKFSKLGVKGFKIDYMDRDDQLIARFLEETARVAAKHKLVLDFHGMHKPAGLSRTYPNVLNYEGVHGLECTKWEDDTDFMRNDLLCLFARMSAGPMDYTPGAMLNYTREQFRASMTKPGSQGTRVHQMALLSMFEAPLQMLCDSPTLYEANAECFRFMSRVPTFWEETKGIAGSMEDYAVLARRLGGAWYLSAINSWEAREIEVDLGFLGKGRWQAEIFADGRNAHRDATDYDHEYRLLEAGGKLKLKLAPGGGWTAKIAPVPVNEAGLRKIKLMSFNIRMGCGHSNPFRLKRGSEGYLPKCAAVIKDAAPDFAGLQEVDRNSARAGYMDQTQVVAGHTGLHGEWVEKIPLYGISTLSKRKPLSVDKVLMKGSSHTRALMISDYGDIAIANTHWPLSAKTRLAAAATTRESLKALALEKPVFLMGDFNAEPGSPEIQSLKEDFAVLSDETLPTWPAKDPKVTIDYIMVDKAHAEKVKVISKQTLPVPDATDHAALVVEVELP